MSRKNGKILFGIIFILAIFFFGFLAADAIQDNEILTEYIASFGYAGILLTGFIAGLNLIVPISATAFAPLFLTTGFSLPEIILWLVIGTTAADLLAYYLGTLGKGYVKKSESKIVQFLIHCCSKKWKYAAAVVFAYAIVVPLPNELLLLPLGALGYRLKHLFVPFFVGNIIHVALLSYGTTSIFNVFF